MERIELDPLQPELFGDPLRKVAFARAARAHDDDLGICIEH
jgi:hypothetical protein